MYEKILLSLLILFNLFAVIFFPNKKEYSSEGCKESQSPIAIAGADQ